MEMPYHVLFCYSVSISGNKPQPNDHCSTGTKENNQTDVTSDSENGCNSSENAYIVSENARNSSENTRSSSENNTVSERDKEVTILRKSSSSEDHMSANIKINNVEDSCTDENNHTACNDSNRCSNSSNIDNNASNVVVATSRVGSLCNGHAIQLSQDSTVSETYYTGTAMEGEIHTSSHSKDIDSNISENICMNNTVSGAGESLILDREQCELDGPRLVNSVSLESCEGDVVEYMQTEGITDEGEHILT